MSCIAVFFSKGLFRDALNIIIHRFLLKVNHRLRKALNLIINLATHQKLPYNIIIQNKIGNKMKIVIAIAAKLMHIFLFYVISILPIML